MLRSILACGPRAVLAGSVLLALGVSVPARAAAQGSDALSRAISHYQAGEWAAARRLFEFLQSQRPAEAPFMSILSDIERGLRNFSAAETWGKRAIAQAPTSGLGQAALAELYHEYGRHGEALQFARSAISGTDPDAPSLVVARELLELGRIPEAIDAVEAGQLEYAQRSMNPPPSAWVDPAAAEWVGMAEQAAATGTASAENVTRLFDGLHGKFPESFRLLGLAKAAVERGDTGRASLYYDSIAITAPDDALLLTIATREAVGDGRVRPVARMLERLADAGTPLTTGVLGLGLGGLVFHDLAPLRPVVETQAQRFPELPEIWLILGTVRRQGGDSAAAEAAFDTALALAPADPGAVSARGHELLSALAYEQAERAARRALALDPANLSAQELLAAVLDDRGRFREAMDVRWAILQKDTAEPAHAFGLGSLALKVDTAFAADTLRALVPRFGGRRAAALRVNLAIALAALGDTAAAVAQLDSAIAADTTWPGAYSERAEFRASRGDLDGAIRDEEVAIRLDSTNRHRIHNLARLYVLAYRFDLALETARRAHGLDATDWDTHFYFALGLRALGSAAPAQELEAYALGALSQGTPERRRAVKRALDRDLAEAARELEAWAASLPKSDAWTWKRLSLEHWAEATHAVARFRRP